MKFAVNYSLQLQNLLKNNHTQVDLIKCPDWDGIIAQSVKYRPVYIHFDILLGIGRIKSLDFDKIRSLLDLTETHYVNCHLVAAPDMDPSSKSDNLRLLKIWEKELIELARVFGIKNISVENYPLMPYHPYQQMAVDASNISKIVESTGCNFLLDLAHARITSLNLSLNLHAYIESLPVSKLVELHVTGIKRFRGYLTDHFELQEADWQLAEWAVEKIKTKQWQEPYCAAFEYGGVGDVFAWRSEEHVLESHIPRLSALFKN